MKTQFSSWTLPGCISWYASPTGPHVTARSDTRKSYRTSMRYPAKSAKVESSDIENTVFRSDSAEPPPKRSRRAFSRIITISLYFCWTLLILWRLSQKSQKVYLLRQSRFIKQKTFYINSVTGANLLNRNLLLRGKTNRPLPGYRFFERPSKKKIYTKVNKLTKKRLGN